MNNSCQGCQERHTGCHSECEKYKEWKAKYSEKKIKMYDEKKKQKNIEDFVIANDRKRKKKGGFIK